MTDINEAPITQAEIIEMFGGEMPVEAVNLVWHSPADWTVGDVRKRLREIAATHHANPAIDWQARAERAEQTLAAVKPKLDVMVMLQNRFASTLRKAIMDTDVDESAGALIMRITVALENMADELGLPQG